MLNKISFLPREYVYILSNEHEGGATAAKLDLLDFSERHHAFASGVPLRPSERRESFIGEGSVAASRVAERAYSASHRCAQESGKYIYYMRK